jgi:hypothetical protein
MGFSGCLIPASFIVGRLAGSTKPTKIVIRGRNVESHFRFFPQVTIVAGSGDRIRVAGGYASSPQIIAGASGFRQP